MKRCCGKLPMLKEHHKTDDSGAEMDFYWCECPNCHRRTSYSYGTPREVWEAWDKGLVTKPRLEM